MRESCDSRRSGGSYVRDKCLNELPWGPLPRGISTGSWQSQILINYTLTRWIRNVAALTDTDCHPWRRAPIL